MTYFNFVTAVTFYNIVAMIICLNTDGDFVQYCNVGCVWWQGCALVFFNIGVDCEHDLF